MAIYQQSHSSVFKRFFEPVLSVYHNSLKQYDCPELTDQDYLEMGILRCLSESNTGRDFLQRHGDHGRKNITVGLNFKALGSNRRLKNISSINPLLMSRMAEACEDPFASITELKDFAVYAGDGHYHAGAAHDEKRKSSSGVEKKPATGHFFMLNQRTHQLRHLKIAEQGGGRKSEHDMRVIKRSHTDELRGGEPKGRKVILAWDKAGIDFEHWQKVKQSAGLYFISLQKKNMKLTRCGYRKIDREDLRNAGVISDEKVAPRGGGAKFRRITYKDPLEGTTYIYLTTEMTLQPGILTLIYKQRWDIEKVFDELKSKLGERKSWSSNPTAKTAQAQFLCLTHNLMILLENQLLRQEEIDNDRERERKAKRKEDADKKGANYVATAIQRFTVRSVKFIRWLRNFVYRKVHWEEAVARLREIYAIF
jgi:IS4 transposase